MKRLPGIISLCVAVFAIVVIAYWPTFVKHSEVAARVASLPTMAPVTPDYTRRDQTIAFWEKMVAKHMNGDMLSPRQLSGQYLQRYREHGDIADVSRAEKAAKQSLRAMPRHNVPAELELASIYLTLHRFHDALRVTHFIENHDIADEAMSVREASLDMEVGEYARARTLLDRVDVAKRDDSWRVVESRYLELTGKLGQARDLLATASAYQNANFDAPAQSRAWYFFRQGEMAFEAGDNDAAVADEKQSIAVFPNFADAYRAEARFECALHRWHECLTSAQASANIVPYPETLGYEVDAEHALGNDTAAKATADTIVAIEKIGNAQHISDRLLAIYYSEHHIRTADAYRIAKRELAVRDDILTEDTLAWAAAMDGRWDEARAADRKAMRFQSENSLLHYHAGVIAEHFGEREQAKRYFTQALALNPEFHQVYADDARAQLAKL